MRHQDSRRVRSLPQHQSIRNPVQLQCVSCLKIDCWIEPFGRYYDSLIKIVIGLKPNLHERVVRASSKIASNLR